MNSPIKTYSIQFEIYFARISSEVSVRTTIKVTTNKYVSMERIKGYLDRAIRRERRNLTLDEMVEEIFMCLCIDDELVTLKTIEIHGEYEYCGILYTCDLRK